MEDFRSGIQPENELPEDALPDRARLRIQSLLLLVIFLIPIILTVIRALSSDLFFGEIEPTVVPTLSGIGVF